MLTCSQFLALVSCSIVQLSLIGVLFSIVFVSRILLYWTVMAINKLLLSYSYYTLTRSPNIKCVNEFPCCYLDFFFVNMCISIWLSVWVSHLILALNNTLQFWVFMICFAMALHTTLRPLLITTFLFHAYSHSMTFASSFVPLSVQTARGIHANHHWLHHWYSSGASKLSVSHVFRTCFKSGGGNQVKMWADSRPGSVYRSYCGIKLQYCQCKCVKIPESDVFRWQSVPECQHHEVLISWQK